MVDKKVRGKGWTLSLAAICFLPVLPLLASIKVAYTALPPKASGQKLRSIADDFRSGWHYCWNHRTVRPLLLAMLMFGINAGVSNVLMIFELTEFFQLTKETLAVTAPVEGVAMFLASLLLTKLKYRQENRVAYSVMMIGVGTAALVFTHVIAVHGLVAQPVFLPSNHDRHGGLNHACGVLLYVLYQPTAQAEEVTLSEKSVDKREMVL